MHWMSPVHEDRYGDRPASPTSSEGTSPPGPDALAEELSRQYRERVRFFAARRLRDRHLAEDVAQEALRRVLEALREGRVKNLSAVPGFLFETARHICQQRARTDSREVRAYQRVAGATSEKADSTDYLNDLITEERRGEVRAAFRQLSDEDQDVLRMSYVSGLDTEEIARRLGAQPGAIRVRRHRALKRLAEIMGVTKTEDREQQ